MASKWRLFWAKQKWTARREFVIARQSSPAGRALIPENIRHPAPQPINDVLERIEAHILLRCLDALKGGRREADLA